MLLWRFGHAAYRSRSKTQEAFVAFAMRSVRLRISIHGARGGGWSIEGAIAASASAEMSEGVWRRRRERLLRSGVYR